MARLEDRLGVDGPGGGAQGGPDGRRVAGVDEADLDAEAGGGVGQQRVGAAVEVALGDQVVAGGGQRQQVEQAVDEVAVTANDLV